MSQETNRHHIFFPRKRWQSGARGQLREHPLSIVRLTKDGHDKLHRHLQPYEDLFRPRISHVIGMLAVAESLGGNELDDVLDRLDRWQGVCKNDGVAQNFLAHQAVWIERGWPDSIQQKLGNVILDGYLANPNSWGERPEL